MNWQLVASRLKAEAADLRERAQTAFPNDFDTQKEMRTRAALMDSLAQALLAGLYQ